MKLSALLGLFFLMFNISCSAPAENQPLANKPSITEEHSSLEELKSVIIENSENYTQAIREVNAEKVLSFLSEDMIIYRPKGDDFIGKPAFRQFIEKFYEGLVIKDLEIEERGIDISDSLAVETVVYSESFSKNGGAFTPIKGRYLAVWKKESSGDWKLSKMVNLP